MALGVGGGSLALILWLKRWPRVPGMLIAVVAATVTTAVFDLASRFDIAVLGPLPQGLPAPRLPMVPAESLSAILMGGVAVALVSFADTSVLSRTYAARLRTPVDPNQEMVGLGIANLAAAFFQGFPISSSSSRTPVAEAAGARTQLTGVVGAIAIGLLLVFAPALLQALPNTALAAIVIASAIGLFEVADLRRIARSLAGTTEAPHFDRTAFKVARIYATLPPDGRTANLKFAPADQEFKCLLAPAAFRPVSGGWGKMGWTTATLAELSKQELKDALEIAWRHVARPRHMLDLVDSR